MSEEVSRLRQRLHEIHQQTGACLDTMLAERQRLIRGTFGERTRLCGNPTCHCTRGFRHASKTLSTVVQGRSRQVHVPARDEVHVAEGVVRYREWHRLRARLQALDTERMEVLDRLFLLLLEPYPPNNPLPPPTMRGRPPGSGRRAMGPSERA